MAVKVHKSPYVNGEPIEYFLQSTQQTFAINQLAKIGSTGAGKLDYADGTSHSWSGLYITMKATTGSTQEYVPVMRVSRDVLYVVDHASSEAVVGTTAQGYYCTVSSSGAAVVGTTGGFRIQAICNTSDTTAEYLIGRFLQGATPSTD